MIKINFLGDSITEGAAASSVENTYVYLVGELLNAEVRNYGVSGTRLAIQNTPSSEPNFDRYFLSRAKNMNHDADYVFVFGGINDFGHGDAPFGEIGDKTSTTFCGAVDELCKYLLSKYPQERIIFIPPLRVAHESNPYGEGNKKVPGKILADYRSALMTVAKKNNVYVLDLAEDFGPGINNPLLSNDGLHPNDAGHKRIAELIVNYLKSII